MVGFLYLILPASLELTFLIALDVFLAIMIIILVAIYFKRRHAEDREYISKAVSPLAHVFSTFDALISDGMLKEAVIKGFNGALATLVNVKRLKVEPYMTAYELVNDGLSNIPLSVRELVKSMYETYEPARFGGIRPGDEDIAKFRDNLKALERYLMSGI